MGILLMLILVFVGIANTVLEGLGQAFAGAFAGGFFI